MAKKPLTPEILKKFVAGDQFRLFYPENDETIVAEITAIKLLVKNRQQELRVEFRGSWILDEHSRPTLRPELVFYDGALLVDLFVSREEEGYLEVPNPKAEQVISFIKPTHRSFASIEFFSR